MGDTGHTSTQESFGDDLSLDTQPSSPHSNIPLDSVFASRMESSTERVLQSVIEHIADFEQRLVDSEFKIERSKETEQRIKEVLNRQVQDGLLSYIEYANLNHVNSLWALTANTLVSYNLGCRMYKRQIFTNLLDLFVRNQISREVYVDFVMQL